MGVAVIWGLAVATFLTLVVVPVMYSSLDPVGRFFHHILIGWWRDRLAGGDEETAAV